MAIDLIHIFWFNAPFNTIIIADINENVLLLKLTKNYVLCNSWLGFDKWLFKVKFTKKLFVMLKIILIPLNKALLKISVS